MLGAEMDNPFPRAVLPLRLRFSFVHSSIALVWLIGGWALAIWLIIHAISGALVVHGLAGAVNLTWALMLLLLPGPSFLWATRTSVAISEEGVHVKRGSLTTTYGWPDLHSISAGYVRQGGVQFRIRGGGRVVVFPPNRQLALVRRLVEENQKETEEEMRRYREWKARR